MTSDRRELIKELIASTDQEFDDEALIHMLLDNEVSTNINESTDRLNFGQRAADAVARFAGSWSFIISFLLVMLAWIVINVILAAGSFDPYPFILLNLVLSCIAAVQAPLIMMSQNRQEAKDRVRAESDYRINLKNELVIADLHTKRDAILVNQTQILSMLEGQPAPEGDGEEGDASLRESAETD